MNRLLISILLLLVVFCASTAHAEDRLINSEQMNQYSKIVSTPIFSQVFVHGLPSGWKMVTSSKAPDGSSFVQGYALDGQTSSDWSELIMVTGMKGMAKVPNSTLLKLIDYMAKSKRVVCPERSFAILMGKTMFGSHLGYVAVLGCGRLSADSAGIKAGEGEKGIYVVVQGESDYYIIQRVQRTAAFDVTPEPLSRTEFSKLFFSLMPIGVCEIGDTPDQCEPKLGGRK